jgi:hydroxymethylglutaryl-CoA reductase (NADPH)
MTTSSKNVRNLIKEFEKEQPIDEYAEQLSPRTVEELEQLKDISIDNSYTNKENQKRLSMLEKHLDKKFDFISGKKLLEDPIELKGHIENYIGMAQVPIGVAGPLLINGAFANGSFYLPLATTEGALVASYNRGMKACLQSGGITVACLTELFQRSPIFKFENIFTVGRFIVWVDKNIEEFKKIVGQVSRYAKLLDVKTNFEGNSIILTFEYSTGDASGQNMVTICTEAICQYIIGNFAPQPVEWYIESNFSGDKKATALSFTNVRGKKVTAEITLKKEIIKEVLKSDADRIYKYWRTSTLATIQSGALGAQGHIANGLTALFIACGQDVACIAESSVGLTRMELTKNGDLYVALTLPSLVVGTVGGGTNLPTQRDCLDMIDCRGNNKAKKFAEVCTALAIAGEISVASALSANQFTSANKKLGRQI